MFLSDPQLTDELVREISQSSGIEEKLVKARNQSAECEYISDVPGANTMLNIPPGASGRQDGQSGTFLLFTDDDDRKCFFNRNLKI